jgi:hypothetical protein
VIMIVSVLSGGLGDDAIVADRCVGDARWTRKVSVYIDEISFRRSGRFWIGD